MLNIELFRKVFSYVHITTSNTNKDRRMVRDFEQLPVLLFAGNINGGLGDSIDLLLTRVVLWSLPTEGYNHASHHISVGEVTAGWCVQCGTWLKAEQLDI